MFKPCVHNTSLSHTCSRNYRGKHSTFHSVWFFFFSSSWSWLDKYRHFCCNCLTLCLTLWTWRRGRPESFLQSDVSPSLKVQLAGGRNSHAISSHNWYDALLPYARHWKRSNPLILSDKAADYHNTYHVRQRLISPHLSSATLVFLLFRCWDNDPHCFVRFLISGETTMTANYHLKDWAAQRKSFSQRR